ncbi:MAG: dihydrolipoamide acetyltransferase family protein [Planctomycetota bacterium]|jgi:pyruvate dehydrogenase E2 component (dihydrolipoamide acetyltransferase)
MAKEVRLPQLGQTMEEGTIVGCLVKIDDEVKKGDLIFEIETDKATLEMESPDDGFVKYILAEIGQTLPVGEALMVLGDRDEDVPESFVDSLKSVAPSGEGVSETASAAPVQAQAQPAAERDKVKASPRAKRLARELGVDLAAIAGTGPAGKITEQDVRAAAEIATKEVGAERGIGGSLPLSRLQKITAERMLQSKREIPCFYLTVKADVTQLVEFRTEFNRTSDVKVSYNDFILRAVAIAMKDFHVMTGRFAGDRIELPDSIDIGLAISVPDGLVAPIVKNVDKKRVVEIARETQLLIEKARNKKLTLTDLEGGCITVSNLGAFGIDSFIPIVVPGQSSILGIGRITDTCVPSNNDIETRKLMSMSLSVDHRVTSGAYAAQFLVRVREVLEDTSRFT